MDGRVSAGSTGAKPKGDAPEVKADESGGGGGSGVSLTTTLVLLAPLFAGIGLLALTGTVGRVLRNAPGDILWAIIFVLLAGAVWLVGDLLAASRTPEKDAKGVPVPSRWDIPVLKFVAIPLALAGFAFGLNAGLTTADDTSRPQISASLVNKDRMLEATVEVALLKTEDRVAIYAHALSEKNGAFETKGGLYEAFVGPDADGNVKHTIKFSVPDRKATDAVGIKAFTSEEAGLCDELKPERHEGEADDISPGTACVVIPLNAQSSAGAKSKPGAKTAKTKDKNKQPK